jgi:pantetheine-phosphate adenylyltransferase
MGIPLWRSSPDPLLWQILPDPKNFFPVITMSLAIYPGTFDPITFGHIDIATRAAQIFTKVIAVVGLNHSKVPLFSAAERLEMARESFKGIDRIEVIAYDGLIANCVRELDASAIIRGLRQLSDFEYEFQMAYTNRKLNPAAETVFLMPSARFTYLNSSMVKQIARFGGDMQNMVPQCVIEALRKKYPEKTLS